MRGCEGVMSGLHCVCVCVCVCVGGGGGDTVGMAQMICTFVCVLVSCEQRKVNNPQKV